MVFSLVKKLLVLATVVVVSVSHAAPNAPFYNERGILQIGTTEPLSITAPAGADRTDFVSYPSASYISVKFENVDLPEGDVIIVRSADSQDGHVYTGKGRGDLGTFASSPVRGSTAVVEYFSVNKDVKPTHVSYQIAGYVRGFASQVESICGRDQSQPAKCFISSPLLPQSYGKAQAVARLLIGGRSLCTGWLAGSAGHMITNEHCITTAADAAQVDIEFEAESGSCGDMCATTLGCNGTIVATSATLVTNSEEHDYSLLKLPDSADIAKYGYLQLRAGGPVTNETIYIPQHPAGWAKRIAAEVDTGAQAKITFTGRSVGCGNNQVGYNADTRGGSSGSPVLSAEDNTVVALHHCGGCENLAVDVRDVLWDLETKGIFVANLIA